MPVLDAKALDADPEGAALLRSVLNTDLKQPMDDAAEKNANGPYRASACAMAAKSCPPLPMVSWTMSKKVSSTSTVRPLTVWLPLSEMSQA